jgi:hypothetical protein
MEPPIVVTISAAPDPDQADKLIVTADRDLVLLSFEDADNIRWVCNDGTAVIQFAPVNNPFDPNSSTGGQYQTAPGGSQVSGPPVESVLDPADEVFTQFKYSITVTNSDGSRSGTLDPHVRVRRRRVYKKEE